MTSNEEAVRVSLQTEQDAEFSVQAAKPRVAKVISTPVAQAAHVGSRSDAPLLPMRAVIVPGRQTEVMPRSSVSCRCDDGGVGP